MNWDTNPADILLHLYDGLPGWVLPIFWIALAVILCAALSLIVLIIRAVRERYRRRALDDRDLRGADEFDYLWVFLVPALNEEVTIADAVSRLRSVDVSRKVILVINDGSDDRTAEILQGIDAPELTVLTRVAPEARQGKSEALNEAWRYVRDVVLQSAEHADTDPARVIVTIVDADGRLDRQAWRVAEHFADERVGGVQSQVRIYNRKGFLTIAQDIEFAVFASVFQLGRTGWGTANMGGNGQFNRLAALNDVAVTGRNGRQGPWREGRLTEDQDIGLRLIQAGWRGAQSSSVVIDQQGLSSLRALYRQRTRWAQGSWQVIDQIPRSVGNRDLSILARIDQLWYLLTPIIQAWLGLSVAFSAVMLATGLVQVEWSVPIIVVLYVLSTAPGIVGVLFARRRTGIRAAIVDVLLAHLYVCYSWLIFPVVYRSLLRYVFRRGGWAKTKREAIDVEHDDQQEPSIERTSHDADT